MKATQHPSTHTENEPHPPRVTRLEGGGVGVMEREIIYLSLHCHHQNDSYITVGIDESHFNVSLIVRDTATRQCPQTTLQL